MLDGERRADAATRYVSVALGLVWYELKYLTAQALVVEPQPVAWKPAK